MAADRARLASAQKRSLEQAGLHGAEEEDVVTDEDCVDFSEDEDRRLALAKLLGMGFAHEESQRALAEAGGDRDAALALLARDLLAHSAAASAQTPSAAAPLRTAGGEGVSGRASAAEVSAPQQQAGEPRSPQAEVDDEEALLIEGEWTKVRALRPGLKRVNLVVILLERVGGPIPNPNPNPNPNPIPNPNT